MMLACGDIQGTFAGFKRHLRASQPLCDPCREARNAYNRKYGIKRREIHKDRINQQQNARYAKLPPDKKQKLAQKHKLYHLKTKYGLTQIEWDQLLEQQKGVCGVCKQVPDARGWATDHNHVTGVVRGILCHKCNIRLGLLGDNESDITKNVNDIKDYLSRTNA
jgi:hypothetical protein